MKKMPLHWQLFEMLLSGVAHGTALMLTVVWGFLFILALSWVL